MERTWRWFGKKDKITLAQLKQIGVEGIVTALHDVPLGEVWTREKIHELKEYIESYGMKWSVVESLSVTFRTFACGKKLVSPFLSACRVVVIHDALQIFYNSVKLHEIVA